MAIEELINKTYNTDKGYLFLVDLIKRKLPNFNIEEKNIETLKIDTMDKEQFMRTTFVGIYEYENNCIKVFTNKDESGNRIYNEEISDRELINTFLHELIHASTSRIKEDGLVYQGINIREDNKDSILVALNEGITQLITDDLLEEESDAYPFLKHFAKQIGLIIGKDKLYEFYSNNDIDGLVNAIDKIYGEEIAKDLINEIYSFSKLENGILKDDGYYLGDKIESQLFDLYLKSGKYNPEFEDSILYNEKVKEFGQLLPRAIFNIEELGFRTMDFGERKGF